MKTGGGLLSVVQWNVRGSPTKYIVLWGVRVIVGLSGPSVLKLPNQVFYYKLHADIIFSHISKQKHALTIHLNK